ncbi:hypothetical protein SCANM63S_06370 [Streptomyces canarius]
MERHRAVRQQRVQRRRAGGCDQDTQRAGPRENAAQHLGRVRGVEGNGGDIQACQRQQGHHMLDGRLQVQGHPAGAAVSGDRTVCAQGRGMRVERRIAQRASCGRDDGGCVRRADDLPCESFGDRGEPGQRGGPASVARQRPPVRGDQLAWRRASTGGERVHAPPEQLGHRLDGLAGETALGVLPQHVQPVGVVDHGHCQRALGVRRRVPQRTLDTAGQSQCRGFGVLQDEQGIERTALAGAVPAGQHVRECHVLALQHLPSTRRRPDELRAQILGLHLREVLPQRTTGARRFRLVGQYEIRRTPSHLGSRVRARARS